MLLFDIDTVHLVFSTPAHQSKSPQSEVRIAQAPKIAIEIVSPQLVVKQVMEHRGYLRRLPHQLLSLHMYRKPTLNR
jgi:hypothetical protein